METDAFAFLFGKTGDGTVKSHQLSPSTLHDNPYQPLYIEDEEPILTLQTATLEVETPSGKSENRKQLNKRKRKKKALSERKRKKKASETTTQNKGKDFNFDFTEEGYPLALFQTGGVEMRNDYETNKRKRSSSPASSTDSKASSEIFYKAQRTYHPEIGESNAKSVERTRPMEKKIQQLKQQRAKRKEEEKKDDKSHNDKVSDTTQVTKGNEEKKEVYTNNVNTYDFPESLPDTSRPSIKTHQIDVILIQALPSQCYQANLFSHGVS
jgi:hypothetical protein